MLVIRAPRISGRGMSIHIAMDKAAIFGICTVVFVLWLIISSCYQSIVGVVSAVLIC